MKLNKLNLYALVVFSFLAGSLLTARFMKTEKVQAQSGHVYELRIYHTLPGRLPALQARFRNHTRRIFAKHHMKDLGYWVPQDSPASDNTLIYILEHDSREAAKKNWSEFGSDPEWREVAKASEADGKIVEKVESTFMNPSDYSPVK